MANLGLESNATPINTGNSVSSKYEQTVCLEDWWLVKSENEIDGKKLAIEGFALKKTRAMCMFSSAPIIKRYNICTLRTADGITILIRGSINASRTLENGFSSEMCGQFLLGFPYCWETYANTRVEDESASRGGVTTSMDAFLESTTMLSSLPNFLRGRTNTRTHDHIFCFPDVAESSVSTENVHASLLEKCSVNDLRNPTIHVSANVICCSPVLGDSLPGKTPSYEERSVSEMKHGREKDLLCGIDGETVEKEKDVLWDEESKLKGDRCMYPENKVLTKKLSEENLETSTGCLRVLLNGAVKSSDIDLLATKETLVDKSETPDDDITVVQLNKEVTKLSVLESLPTEETPSGKKDGENVNLLSPSRRITRNSLENVVNYGKASNGHHVSKKNLEEKCASTSPNEGSPIKDFRSSSYSAMKNDLPKDILVPMAKDMNTAHSSGVDMALTVYLKNSSKGLGSSKTSSKGGKKTRVNLKSSRPANPSCGFISGKADSLKEASASICSGIKNLSPSEVNVAAPGNIPYSTLVSVRGFSKTKVGCGSSKGTTCHSVSGSQGSNAIQLCVGDKLSHGFTAGIAGILQESLSEAPLAGTPDILDIAGDYIDHPMEDSPRQVNLEPNVSCSTKLGMNTQSAATRNRSRVKNLEGKGRANTIRREHLSGSDATRPSICKIDAMEEMTDSPKGRRTNSRVKISRNKSKVDKPTNRDISGLDRPNDIFQETVPGKSMWKEVPLLRSAGINRKIKYSNTPEQPALTLKRSRCGRLLIPPLEFWRNEQLIYDVDREITGIQEGTPIVEHHRGSRSEPPKIKGKLLYS